MFQLVRLAAALTMLSAACGPLRAATLAGSVRDPSGAAVAGAQISAREERTAEIARATTDGQGHFALELSPGSYVFEVTLAGFAPAQRRVMLDASGAPPLDIKLELAEARAEVSVRGKGESQANSDPNYRALRDAQTRESFSVQNIVLKRDRGALTLKSGRISFIPPVLGRVTMAAFSGEGEFTLDPAVSTERHNIHLITGGDTVEESFTRLALCFTDGTYEEIRRQAEKGPDAAPEREALNELHHRLRRRPDPPRSMLEYMLTSESIDNVEADILADLYNPKRPGFFSAYIFGRKHGDLRFHVRPLGVLAQLPSPEEVAVINADPEGNEEGIWYLAHYETEYAAHHASSREDKRVMHVDHYRIETAINRHGRFTATAALDYTALGEGDRVFKFGLLPTLRVTRVSMGEREIAYVQEKRNEDGSFYVIVPDAAAAGQHDKILIEYEGNKVLSDEGGGNFSVGARTSWYPSVNAFGDRSTFDLTFKVPKEYTLVSVGKPVREWREGDSAASQWTSDIPFAVAGFNYGRFKKKERTDETTRYDIEGYATAELPSYLAQAHVPAAMTPSRLSENAMIDAENAIRVFSRYFGPAPYGRIAITQQPEFNFGQSWPTLVYLPISAFLDPTQRWMLMGPHAFRFADFIQEVTSHEVAHQWWGHMVGWASYHDQWLSEGFADFSAGLFLQLTEKRADKYLHYWDQARKQILDKNQFGIRANDVGPLWMGLRLNTRKTAGAYNRLVYPKGGYVLHMLRCMMRDPKTHDAAFIAMMRDFVQTYYGQNAATADFQKIVEKHMTPDMNLDGNGRMDWFFNEWVYNIDSPSYRLDYSLTEEGGKMMLTGTVEQSGVSDKFKMLVPLYLDFTGTPVTVGHVALSGNRKSNEFHIALPERPKRVLLNAEHDVLASEVVVSGK